MVCCMCVQAALEQCPHATQLSLLLAQLHMVAGKGGKALSIAKAAAQAAPTDADAVSLHAMMLEALQPDSNGSRRAGAGQPGVGAGVHGRRQAYVEVLQADPLSNAALHGEYQQRWCVYGSFCCRPHILTSHCRPAAACMLLSCVCLFCKPACSANIPTRMFHLVRFHRACTHISPLC